MNYSDHKSQGLLEVNSTMNELGLRSNRISTEGLLALGEGLTVNGTKDNTYHGRSSLAVVCAEC